MSEIKNEPTINEEKVNINRNAIEHRATWMGLTYVEGEKAGVPIEEITRKAISETGAFHGKNYRSQVKNPDDVSEFTEVFLPEVGRKTFEMDIVKQDDSNLWLEFHYCPLLAAWKKQGFDDETCRKLCDCAMDGDRNIAKAMGYDFELGKTIANGDPVCEIKFKRR